jgi:hypothetical protein
MSEKIFLPEHLTLGQIDQLNGTGNIATGDELFDPCAELLAGNILTLTHQVTQDESSSLSIWLKRQTEATIVTLIGNTVLGSSASLQVTADGHVGLYQENDQLQGGTHFQWSDSDGQPRTDMSIESGVWYHLAWTKENDRHTLYLNGVVSDSQDLTASLSPSLNPSAISDIRISGATARLAHLKYYSQTMNIEQAAVDWQSQIQASETFYDDYALNFAIANIIGDRWESYENNKLFIEDMSGKARIRQLLRVTNQSPESLVIPAGTGQPSHENNRLIIHFRNATLTQPDSYLKFSNFTSDEITSLAGWSMSSAEQQSEDGSWCVYFLPTSDVTLEAGQSINFPFEYLSALREFEGVALGARGTRVALTLNLPADEATGQGAICNMRQKQVDVLNLSSNDEQLTEQNELITSVDTRVDELEERTSDSLDQLELLIASMSGEDPLMPGNRNINTMGTMPVVVRLDSVDPVRPRRNYPTLDGSMGSIYDVLENSAVNSQTMSDDIAGVAQSAEERAAAAQELAISEAKATEQEERIANLQSSIVAMQVSFDQLIDQLTVAEQSRIDAETRYAGAVNFAAILDAARAAEQIRLTTIAEGTEQAEQVKEDTVTAATSAAESVKQEAIKQATATAETTKTGDVAGGMTVTEAERLRQESIDTATRLASAEKYATVKRATDQAEIVKNASIMQTIHTAAETKLTTMTVAIEEARIEEEEFVSEAQADSYNVVPTRMTAAIQRNAATDAEQIQTAAITSTVATARSEAITGQTDSDLIYEGWYDMSWNQDTAYDQGYYVLKDATLYRATTDISASAWQQSDWDDVSWSGSASYVEGDYVLKDNQLYRANVDTSGGWQSQDWDDMAFSKANAYHADDYALYNSKLYRTSIGRVYSDYWQDISWDIKTIYPAASYVFYQDKLYRSNVAATQGLWLSAEWDDLSWDNTKDYVTGDYVFKDAQLYQATSDSDSALTQLSSDWSEASWVINHTYEEGAYVFRDNHLYRANTTTTSDLWLPLEWDNMSYTSWDQASDYVAGSQVIYEDNFYRANSDLTASAWQASDWTVVSWPEYVEYDYVLKDNTLYKAQQHVIGSEWQQDQWEDVNSFNEDRIYYSGEYVIHSGRLYQNNIKVSHYWQDITWSPDIDYAEGDYVLRDNNLYRSTNAIPADATWEAQQTAGSDVTWSQIQQDNWSDRTWVQIQEYAQGDYVLKDNQLYRATTAISGVLDLADLTYNQTQAYSQNDYVLKDGALYRANTDINANAAWVDSNWQERSWTDRISYARHDCVFKDGVLYRARFVVPHSRGWKDESWDDMSWVDTKRYLSGDHVLQDGNLFKVKDNWTTQTDASQWEAMAWLKTETYTTGTDYVQYNDNGELTLHRATRDTTDVIETNISGWDSDQWEEATWLVGQTPTSDQYYFQYGDVTPLYLQYDTTAGLSVQQSPAPKLYGTTHQPLDVADNTVADWEDKSWSVDVSYQAGDYVWYNSRMYRAHPNAPTQGQWLEAEWQERTFNPTQFYYAGEYFVYRDDLYQAMANITDAWQDTAWDVNNTYAQGDYVLKDGTFYKAIMTPTPNTWSSSEWQDMSWNASNAYKQNDHVLNNGKLYKAYFDVAAGSWNDQDWTDVSWTKDHTYVANQDYMQYNDGSDTKLYKAILNTIGRFNAIDSGWESSDWRSMGFDQTKIYYENDMVLHNGNLYSQSAGDRTEYWHDITWTSVNEYVEGEYVLKDGTLYKAISAPTTGTWSSGEWQDMSWLNSVDYTQGDYVLKDNQLYRAKGAVVAGQWDPTLWSDGTWALDQKYIAGQNYVQYNQGNTLRLYKATLSTSARVRHVVDVQGMNNKTLVETAKVIKSSAIVQTLSETTQSAIATAILNAQADKDKVVEDRTKLEEPAEADRQAQVLLAVGVAERNRREAVANQKLQAYNTINILLEQALLEQQTDTTEQIALSEAITKAAIAEENAVNKAIATTAGLSDEERAAAIAEAIRQAAAAERLSIDAVIVAQHHASMAIVDGQIAEEEDAITAALAEQQTAMDDAIVAAEDKAAATKASAVTLETRQAEAQCEKDIEVGTFEAEEPRKQTVSEAITLAQTDKKTARSTRDDTINQAIIDANDQRDATTANIKTQAETAKADALDLAQQDDGEISEAESEAAQNVYDSTIVTETANAEITRQQSIATAMIEAEDVYQAALVDINNALKSTTLDALSTKDGAVSTATSQAESTESSAITTATTDAETAEQQSIDDAKLKAGDTPDTYQGNYGTLPNGLTQTIGKISCLAFASAHADRDMLTSAITLGLSDLHQDVVDGNLTPDKVAGSTDTETVIRTAIRNRDHTALLEQIKLTIRTRPFEPSLWHEAQWGQSRSYLEGDYVTYPASAALNSSDCKLYRALDDIAENTEWDVNLWQEDTFWRGSWDQQQEYVTGDYVSYPAASNYTLYKAIADIPANTAWNAAQWEDISWDVNGTYIPQVLVWDGQALYVSKEDTAEKRAEGTLLAYKRLETAVSKAKLSHNNDTAERISLTDAINQTSADQTSAVEADTLKQLQQKKAESVRIIENITNEINELKPNLVAEDVNVVNAVLNVAVKSNIAWSPSTAYSSGQYVTYSNKLYLATGTPTQGQWESDLWAEQDLETVVWSTVRSNALLPSDADTLFDEKSYNIMQVISYELQEALCYVGDGDTEITGIATTVSDAITTRQQNETDQNNDHVVSYYDSVIASAIAGQPVATADATVDELKATITANVHNYFALTVLKVAVENTVAAHINLAAAYNTIENTRIKSPPVINANTNFTILALMYETISGIHDNIKALDDEVDARAEANQIIFDQLETPFPLVASVAAPEGVLINKADTTLQFTLLNVTNEKVQFTQTAEFRFIVAIGDNPRSLVRSHSQVGQVGAITTSAALKVQDSDNPYWEKDNNASGSTSIFRWRPTRDKNTEQVYSDYESINISPRGKVTFDIDQILPNNHVGTTVIFIEYQGIVGNPSGKMAVNVTKVSRDIAASYGNENVGIGKRPSTKPSAENFNKDTHARLEIDGTTLIGYETHQSTQINDAGQEVTETLYTTDYKLGINKTSPQRTLDVGGGIRCDETITADGTGTTDQPADINTQNGKIKENGHDLLPTGSIIMWSGSTAPSGWHLCNGQRGTPDLSGRFIVGIGANSNVETGETENSIYNYKDTGGLNKYSLATSEIPAHNHVTDADGVHNHTAQESGGGHTHKYEDTSSNFRTEGTDNRGWQSGHSDKNSEKDTSPSTNLTITVNDNGSHTHNIQNTGGDQPHENRPAFYALAFIMKMPVNELGVIQDAPAT